MRSPAAGQSQGRGREAHSTACSGWSSLCLPVLLLLQGELEEAACHPESCLPILPSSRACSVSLASRRRIPNPPRPPRCPLGPAASSCHGAVCRAIPGSPEPLSAFLFRQTNKSRFGYHGRAVRHPTQTEAARLASPDAPGSAQAIPGQLPRSALALLPSPQGPLPQVLSGGCVPWGPGTPRLQQRAGTLKSWLPQRLQPPCFLQALAECPASEGLGDQPCATPIHERRKPRPERRDFLLFYSDLRQNSHRVKGRKVQTSV